jgi:hypothetical protein
LRLGGEVSAAFFSSSGHKKGWKTGTVLKKIGGGFIAEIFSRFVAQIDRRKATEKVRANGKMSDIFTFIIA